MHAYLRNHVNPLPGCTPPPSILLLLLWLPVAEGNDGLVQQASSSTACLLASLPVGGSIWSASRADEWTKHNLSTKDKSACRQCGSIYICFLFFLSYSFQKKSACSSSIHIVFLTHDSFTPLAYLNIYSRSIKEVLPFPCYSLPLAPE